MPPYEAATTGIWSPSPTCSSPTTNNGGSRKSVKNLRSKGRARHARPNRSLACNLSLLQGHRLPFATLLHPYAGKGGTPADVLSVIRAFLRRMPDHDRCISIQADLGVIQFERLNLQCPRLYVVDGFLLVPNLAVPVYERVVVRGVTLEHACV